MKYDKPLRAAYNILLCKIVYALLLPQLQANDLTSAYFATQIFRTFLSFGLFFLCVFFSTFYPGLGGDPIKTHRM